MSFNQSEVGRRFRNGKTSGKASNVEIKNYDDFTALVGYGWAVYAVRNKQTGDVIYFSGWDGYSQSTTCQLNKLKLRERNKEDVSASPQTRTRYNPDSLIISDSMTWNDILSALVSDYELNRELVA
jgi:hypothetical protein